MKPKVSEVMTAIKSETGLEAQAVAAIRAMRNPTPEMLTAAAKAGPSAPPSRGRHLGDIIAAEYNAAIDEAIS